MDRFGWLPWVRRRRLARERALAAAEAAQRAATKAAIRRIIEEGHRNERPGWDARTMPLPQLNRVLMTPAAEHRTRRNRRA
jgi:hypothetical protein